MKFVQKIKDGDYYRCVCPECGSTLTTYKEGELPMLPEYCKHCGSDVFYTDESFGTCPDGYDK